MPSLFFRKLRHHAPAFSVTRAGFSDSLLFPLKQRFPVKLNLSIFAGLVVTLLPVQAWQADLGDGTYKNPVLFSDYSDPDVIRVGSDFYMVSSSFHYMPGIPILKSPDLVNWTIIGHVFPRLDISPEYNLVNGDRYGKGAWAPAIRYHNNRFYVYFPTPQEGIFMTSAAKAEGPWDPIVTVIAKAGLEDPCPFWDDDGSAYLVHSLKGAGPLILHKMSPDGKTVLDDGKLIVSDKQNLPNLEGPKFYKRNGYYYILAPIRGVSGGWQAALRSKNIYGPYDYKILLTQGTTPTNGPHQGGYVETPSGQGWFLHFQSKGAYGRILHLEPVHWVDDWPLMGQPDPTHDDGYSALPPAPDAVVGQNAGGPIGQPVLTFKKPDTGTFPVQVPQTSDEFNSPILGLQWQWNHNPDDQHWSLTERPGYLRLKALPAPELLRARNTLTQMLNDPALDATTSLDTTGMADGQQAGLCMISNPPGGIGVLRHDGKCAVYSFSGKNQSTGPDLTQTAIQLRVHIENQTATFFYSLDGSNFISFGQPLKLVFSWWKGARPGLYSFNTDPTLKDSSGVADFDWFHYEPK